MMTQSPYKGLLPYDQQDRHNFFGREQEKEILLGKILSYKLTLLYAATGVGKSSLLGAAVLPELEDLDKENLDVAYHRTWIDEPVAAIQQTVKQALHRRKKIVEDEFQDLDSGSLPEFFRRCSDYSSDPLVLVLDQFEELFRYHAGLPHFLPFIEQLSEVITNRDLPLTVVLSMREDFLAELSVFRGQVPGLFNNYYRLQRLSLQQAREAIIKPVQQEAFGFRYEEGLLDRLITDLAARQQAQEDAQLPDLPQRTFTAVEGPYLQIVCMELWHREQHNPEKTMRQATYDALGGANTIVKRYFEQIMAGCTAAERKLAARAFAFLVTEWGTKMAYPESVLAKILKVKLAKLQPILRRLNAARILRDEQRPEGTWYELYHDMFAGIIEDWSRAFGNKRRQRTYAVLMAFALAFMGTLGVAVYQRYQKVRQDVQVARNAGTVQVQNPLGATLTLTCVHRYGDAKTCPAGPIPLKGASVELAGPADYLLTAHQDDWTMRYPVYVQGYGHRLVVAVESPPAPVLPDMAYVPGGTFRMGDKDDRDAMGKADELPHHDVEVTGFFLDTHEITNAQYHQCVRAGVCTAPHYADGTCVAAPQVQVDEAFQEEHKPVVCVDWQQASDFCAYAKKRLPTEAEWEKAAAGPEGYKWSFGNTFGDSKANNTDNRLGGTTPVGVYPANGYGLYDMSGNVWEWVEDRYDATFYGTSEARRKNPLSQEHRNNARVKRGGSWYLPAEGVRSARRDFDWPDGRDTQTGFRCAHTLE
jgi:formylglycine-generating enzyme required for sulfatase activity